MVILFIILLWVTYVMAELREQRTFIIDKEELEERLQKELYKND